MYIVGVGVVVVVVVVVVAFNHYCPVAMVWVFLKNLLL